MNQSYPYIVYITTNRNKTVLYTDMTGNISARLSYHTAGANRKGATDPNWPFATRYQAQYILWYEVYANRQEAVLREKQIRGWTRAKKIALINNFNPDWKFLNNELLSVCSNPVKPHQ